MTIRHSSAPNGAHPLTPQGVLQTAEQAVESVRGFTNDSLDRAGSVAEELSARAQELARKGIAAASGTSAQAQKAMHRYADTTTKYVAEQPVKSVLIAAAIGAALAALVIAARNRD